VHSRVNLVHHEGKLINISLVCCPSGGAVGFLQEISLPRALRVAEVIASCAAVVYISKKYA
jgi:hypothetical protein